MRVFDQGSLIRVTADTWDIDRFRDNFPASGLTNLRSLAAYFEKKNGDLVDLYTNGKQGARYFDGTGLSALLDDMKKYGEQQMARRRRNPTQSKTVAATPGALAIERRHQRGQFTSRHGGGSYGRAAKELQAASTETIQKYPLSAVIVVAVVAGFLGYQIGKPSMPTA